LVGVNHTKLRIVVKIARIMATKLTLSVEENVIKRAKSYAKNAGRSLSELIENYLIYLISLPL